MKDKLVALYNNKTMRYVVYSALVAGAAAYGGPAAAELAGQLLKAVFGG